MEVRKKTGGRTKGVGNKNLEPIRDAFREFVEGNLTNIQENYNTLDAKDQLLFVMAIAEYCIPKMARVEVTGKGGDELKLNVNVSNIANKAILDGL